MRLGYHASREEYSYRSCRSGSLSTNHKLAPKTCHHMPIMVTMVTMLGHVILHLQHDSLMITLVHLLTSMMRGGLASSAMAVDSFLLFPPE